MPDHHNDYSPQAHAVLFTTPTALTLDVRLTPLERNGWQVGRMLRAADGRSSMANLVQLRSHLTSTPLGTARRLRDGLACPHHVTVYAAW